MLHKVTSVERCKLQIPPHQTTVWDPVDFYRTLPRVNSQDLCQPASMQELTPDFWQLNKNVCFVCCFFLVGLLPSLTLFFSLDIFFMDEGTKYAEFFFLMSDVWKLWPARCWTHAWQNCVSPKTPDPIESSAATAVKHFVNDTWQRSVAPLKDAIIWIWTWNTRGPGGTCEGEAFIVARIQSWPLIHHEAPFQCEENFHSENCCSKLSSRFSTKNSWGGKRFHL